MLAQELQLSRSPVTEALKRLESTGLVEILPQVGCRVIRVSASMADELFSLRGAIDGLTAGRAAERRTDRQLRDLKLMLTRMDAVIERGDWPRFDVLNYEFHMGVTHASGMPRVEQVVAGVWPLLRFCLVQQRPCSTKEMSAAATEHRHLFQHIADRDGEAARAQAQRHAAEGLKRFLGRIRGTDATLTAYRGT